MAAVAAVLLILSLLGRDFDAETSQPAWEAPQEPPKYGSALAVVSTHTSIHCSGHTVNVIGRLQCGNAGVARREAGNDGIQSPSQRAAAAS